MTAGRGFALRVTLQSLPTFARLLKPEQVPEPDDATATPTIAVSLPADPELVAVEAMFAGESLRVRLPFRSPRRASRKRSGSTPTRPVPQGAAPTVGTITPGSPPAATRGQLLWEKRSLPATDAQRPPNAGSNPTGNLRLAQAHYRTADGKLIDHKKYFRETAFGLLEWRVVQKSPKKEEVAIRTQVVVNGASLGIHDLTLSHQSSRISGQGNVPTVLHWGSALTQRIRDANITGSTLRIYAPAGAGSPFVVEIAK